MILKRVALRIVGADVWDETHPNMPWLISSGWARHRGKPRRIQPHSRHFCRICTQCINAEQNRQFSTTNSYDAWHMLLRPYQQWGLESFAPPLSKEPFDSWPWFAVTDDPVGLWLGWRPVRIVASWGQCRFGFRNIFSSDLTESRAQSPGSVETDRYYQIKANVLPALVYCGGLATHAAS